MTTDTMQRAGSATYESHRRRLWGIAYRMLGSVHDAEDVVQESFLRWHAADTESIRVPEAWLVRVATRLSIDRLRRASAEREQYVGDWLPEPVVVDDGERPDRHIETASDLSMAFLVLLERLSPEERAAFLLREVFDAPYTEIAAALDRSEEATRQVLHRARRRVRDGRVRMRVPADAKERLLRRFLDALAAEDREALLEIVKDDATFVSDHGGKVRSARNIIHGAEKIVRFSLGLERKRGPGHRQVLAWINAEPTIVNWIDGRLAYTTSIETDGERILALYRVLNPAKLLHLRIELAAPGAGWPDR